MEPMPWFYLGAGAGLALVARSAIRPHWSWRKLRRHAVSALIAGSLGVLVLACLNPENGIGPYAGSCLANLRAIQNAKIEWAKRFQTTDSQVPRDSVLFGAGKLIPSKPVCPEGGTYRLDAVNEDPVCTLWRPGHYLPHPSSKDFKDNASAKVFFVLCGLAIVALLQLLQGAWQAAWHASRFGRVLSLSVFWLLLPGVILVAVPNFVKACAHSGVPTCVANLKQIDGAKATWAMEEHKPPTAVPTESDLFGPRRYIRITPLCRKGGIYHLGTVNELPTCAWGGPEHRLEKPVKPSPQEVLISRISSFLVGLIPFVGVLFWNRTWESRRRRRPPATP